MSPFGTLGLASLLSIPASAQQRSIREVDFKKYLIERENLVEMCKEHGAGPDGLLRVDEVEFADLDGDGAEEAVVEATTCAMGFGGADIVEVLKRLSSGELRKLRITNEGYRPPKEYDGMGTSPRLDVKDGKLISWYVIHAKRPKKPKSGWKKTLVYKWTKDRFVVDRVVETRAFATIPP